MNLLNIIVFPIAILVFPVYLCYHGVAKPVCRKCRIITERRNRKRLIKSLPNRIWELKEPTEPKIIKNKKDQRLFIDSEADNNYDENEPDLATISNNMDWTSSTQCSICLENYISKKSRVMTLPCSHEFHFDCISKWIIFQMVQHGSAECPLCKNPIKVPRKKKP